MSIAVSVVQTRVRKITRRDNTTELPDADLNVLILESCLEIAKRTLCLESSTTGTLSADGTSITVPTDMVDSDAAIDEIYLNTILQDRITFAEWRSGKIKGYAYKDGTIYIEPTSDNDRSYTLYYRKVHGALSTNLEFEDDLKMAVIWLTCKKVYENYFAESDAPATKAERQYEREISINAPAELAVSRMRTTRE
jgi:hypothetical protein